MRNFLLVRRNPENDSKKIVAEGVEFSGGPCVVSWSGPYKDSVSLFKNAADLQSSHCTPGLYLVWRDYESLLRAAKGLVNNWYEFEGPAAGFEERLHYFGEALKELEKEL
jgi:hypothetical protein